MTNGIEIVRNAMKELGIKAAPGKYGWPKDALHIPSVDGLQRGLWVQQCGTKGCLVGHIGSAFLDGSYIESVKGLCGDTLGRAVTNNDFPPAAYDLMKLILVRLGVPAHDVVNRDKGWCLEPKRTWCMTSDVFETGIYLSRPSGEGLNERWFPAPSFGQVVEAWCDVAEAVGYVVTTALRKKVTE